MSDAERHPWSDLGRRVRRALPGRSSADAAPQPERAASRPVEMHEGRVVMRFEVGPHAFAVASEGTEDSYVAHLGEAPLPAAVMVAGAVVPPDGVLFDVGANIGLCAAAFASFAPNGSVEAFEPGDRAYGDLVATVELNGYDNVRCHHTAVGAEDGSSRLLVPNWNASGAFMAGATSASALHEGNGSVSVTEVGVRSLDSVVDELGIDRLDVLKIDVEGHEDAVLAGAARTLERFRPVTVIEFNVFTLSVFVGRNPLEFLVDAVERFPHVVAVDPALRTEKVTDVPSAYDLTHRCFTGGQVVDLVCSWEPLDDRLRFAGSAEG
ncbi:MAG: FkbM family methyltransferase [Actinomycetota bacterium]|nr:FkbM family methyltransferase [Actinomycetota bacterium]